MVVGVAYFASACSRYCDVVRIHFVVVVGRIGSIDDVDVSPMNQVVDWVDRHSERHNGHVVV